MRVARTRRAISEIVSALLLTAATLSLGGYMTVSLSSQLSGSNQGILVALQQQQESTGKLLSLTYSGLSSGKLVVQVYNYGFTSYAPAYVFVNITSYSSSLQKTNGQPIPTIAPNSAANVVISGTFTRVTGQTIYLVDSYGVVFQFAT
ncbi:MAG: hypothetical protein LYZ69_01390 [Nitrososphaerales archaeon]|nr:hypothetical protein [Nitrososphaerales archaeon]